MPGEYNAESVGEERRKNLKSVGIAEIVIASASILFEMVTIALYARDNLATEAPGIWCGIWVIVAGSLALSCSKGPSRNKVITGTVFAGLGMGFSFYMIYYEGALASALSGSGYPTVYTHGLLVITGIGHIVSTSVHIHFARKAKKEACS